MASWFKSKSNPDTTQSGESRTSHERPLPRDEHDDIVTERTRLLGQNIEAEIQPSPYNLVVVRSLRNISNQPPKVCANTRYLSDACHNRMVDCPVRLGFCQCPRTIYSRQRLHRTRLRFHHQLCTHKLHHLFRYSTSPRCTSIVPHVERFPLRQRSNHPPGTATTSP